MQIGLSLSLTGQLRSGGFSPAILFAGGEVGAWFEPSPTTTFTDTERTVPAAVGNAVASMTDLSGLGNHATQDTAAARPILRQAGTGEYYLEFDGVDDFMVTPSINFTGTNKMSVFAGVRKLNDAISVALEISTNQTANARAFVLATGPIPGPLGTLTGYIYRSRGNAAANANHAGQAATFSAPDTAVISGVSDISGDTSQIRRNGVAGTTGTADQGTGNYGNYPLYIGSRAGSQAAFNGHIYSMIVRGALTDGDNLTKTEAYVASKTAGVTL
jgi:hypothetical protein